MEKSSQMKKILTDERIVSVRETEKMIQFNLADGRQLAVPLAWFPRLANASPEERSFISIRGGGFAVHWDKIDEHLEIFGLLAGNPAPELRRNLAVDANSITELRKASAMTQDEFAAMLGVRKATISDWEKNKIQPSALAKAKLSELLRRHYLAAQELPTPTRKEPPKRIRNPNHTTRTGLALGGYYYSSLTVSYLADVKRSQINPIEAFYEAA